MALLVIERHITPNRKSRKRLFKRTKSLCEKLLPETTASEKLNKAQRYANGYLGPKKWERWGWLIRNHRIARDQLKCLTELSEHVNVIPHLNLDEKRIKEFSSLFSGHFNKDIKIDDLEQALDNRRTPWRDLVKTIRVLKPRVFLSHAFLNLSENSGIEIVSIFVGGLIALGALYMAFFFQAAAGQSASTYWTLNDLIVHGILVVPLVMLLLLALEIVFIALQKATKPAISYQIHDSVLKHSIWWVLGFLLLAALFTSSRGYERGADRFDDFIAASLAQENGATEPQLEMATVMDGSVLTDVFLVGTTDRTAVFLRPTTVHSELGTEKPLAFLETALCVASEFTLESDYCNRRPSNNYKVLVMDRALVVCHARMEDCEIPARSSWWGDAEVPYRRAGMIGQGK